MPLANFAKVASVKYGATDLQRVMFNGQQLWPGASSKPSRGIVVPPGQAVVLITWDDGSTNHSGMLRGRYTPTGGGFGNLSLSAAPGGSPLRFDIPPFTGEAVFQFLQDQGHNENTIDYKATPGQIIVIHVDWTTKRGVLVSNQIPYVPPGPDDPPYDYTVTTDDTTSQPAPGTTLHIDWPGNDMSKMTVVVTIPGRAPMTWVCSNVATTADGHKRYTISGPPGYTLELEVDPVSKAMWMPVGSHLTMSTGGGELLRNSPVHGTPPAVVHTWDGVWMPEDTFDPAETTFLWQQMSGGQPQNSFGVQQIPAFLAGLMFPPTWQTDIVFINTNGDRRYMIMQKATNGWVSREEWNDGRFGNNWQELISYGRQSGTEPDMGQMHYGKVSANGLAHDRGVVQH